jgi:hypothetical protein
MTKTHQEFMIGFNDERKPLVEAILEVIRETDPSLSEIIKWNSPTFCHNGKDRMTIMLHKKDRVGVILHTGAKPKEDKKAPRLYTDATGLLDWNSNIRATISFFDLTEFSAKKDIFKQAIAQWVDETKAL